MGYRILSMLTRRNNTFMEVERMLTISMWVRQEPSVQAVVAVVLRKSHPICFLLRSVWLLLLWVCNTTTTLYLYLCSVFLLAWHNSFNAFSFFRYLDFDSDFSS